VGAIDAAALCPFRKWARGGTDERKKSHLYSVCNFSGWYANVGKITKIVAA